MATYLDLIKKELATLRGYTVEHVPREENYQADALARLASAWEGVQDKTIPLSVLNEPSATQAEIMEIDGQETWMGPIIRYLNDRIEPDDKVKLGGYG